MSTDHIERVTTAASADELRARVMEAADDLECRLDPSLSYSEQASLLDQEVSSRERKERDAPRLADMARVLHAAQNRWFEIDSR